MAIPIINKVLQPCKAYRVKRIVLTHAHFDHAENAARISDRWGIPIGMNEGRRGLLENRQSSPAILCFEFLSLSQRNSFFLRCILRHVSAFPNGSG